MSGPGGEDGTCREGPKRILNPVTIFYRVSPVTVSGLFVVTLLGYDWGCVGEEWTLHTVRGNERPGVKGVDISLWDG